MRYRRTRPGEPTHLFLPEEYVQSHPDENQLDDANPDRPLFWQSGEGTIDRPTLIIANATDIK